MAIDFNEVAIRAEIKAYHELQDMSLGYITDEVLIMRVCDAQEFLFTSCENELSRNRVRNHRTCDLLA